MTDRLLALAALTTLAVFVVTVPLFVPETDLVLLTILCVGLAAFDFWRELFKRKNGS